MSTFELFLQLPLFKGIEMDDLFSLIPKINLDFERFQPGDIVIDRKMEAKGLVYLLKGEVKICSKGNEQIVNGPVLLSFSGLFGTDKQFLADVSATNVCNTLNIDTKSLLYLLRNCPVFLSNYLDLLSNTIGSLYLERKDFLIV
jgi:hypothetical protein